MICDECKGTGELEDGLRCWQCKGKGTYGWIYNGRSFIFALFDLLLLTFLFCGGLVSLTNEGGIKTLYWWGGFFLVVILNLVYLLLAISGK